LPEHKLMRGNRDLRLLVGAVGLSALGDTFAFIPLMLHLQEETGSGIAVASLLIAFWGPLVVLAGPAGLLVDSVESRRLLLGVSLAQAALGAALAFAFVGGLLPILVLAALLGVGLAIVQPAEFALVPVVAGPERVKQANGYVETGRYLGFALGPILGGVLAAGGATRIALLLNAASFLAVAAAAWALRARRRPERVRAAEGEPDRARDGVVFLFRDRILAVVMSVAFVSVLFFSASTPAEVFFATDFLHAGAIGYGALMTGWTVGMGIGATLLAGRVSPRLLATAALVGVAIQGAGIATPTLYLAFWLALAGFLIAGAGLGLRNVMARTLIHERVPERLHGRAFAAYNGLRNGAELIALAGGGGLVAAIGARWTLLIAGALPVLAAVAGLAVLRARREPVAAEVRAA